MIMNSQKIAEFCGVLRNPHTLNILQDLIHEKKYYSYFSNKYGNATRYTVRELERLGVTKKIFDVAKIQIGYEITEDGRWIYHSCVNFQRKLEMLNL